MREIRVDNDIAHIPLNRGLEAIIDIEDLDGVCGFRWSALVNKIYGNTYVARAEGKKLIFLHRQLLNPPKGLIVDHIDGNGLNNRRSNIRVCNPSQNQANKIVRRDSALGIKGVRPTGQKYEARIKLNGKRIYLGAYQTKEEASAAYMRAATSIYGEFARNE